MPTRTQRAAKPKPKPAGTLRQGAYEQLLEAIIFGDMAPGSVVDEKRVAVEQGLGLGPLREALQRLALEGFVERHARIGTRVRELGLREMHEVFELRIILEGQCAGLAAERGAAEDFALMRSALDGYEAAIEARDFRSLVRMDRAFHRAVAKGSQNELMARQITALHDVASRFWYFGLRRIDLALARADMAAHLDVVDCMERHDTAAAISGMQALLGHFPENVRLFMTPVVPSHSDPRRSP